jgi:hypothetical protein
VPIRLQTPFLDISEHLGVLRIIVSVEDNLGAEQYLMIQRDLEPSDEHVRLGSSGVYIETCGQGWSWYEHIDSFTLRPDGIEVKMDSVAAAELRDEGVTDDGMIMVSFRFTKDDFTKLRVALQRAFEGREYFSVAAA